MKILFVTPPPYLPNRYHRMRSFDIITMLSKKHDVHLVCVTTQKKEPEEFSQIRNMCKSVTIIYLNPFIALFNCIRFFSLPLEVAYCYQTKVNSVLQKIIKSKRIDVLYVKRLRSALYIENIKKPIVLDTTDAMSLFYFRLYEHASNFKKWVYLFEALKYRAFEKKVLQQNIHWVTCSEIDKKYLETVSSASISVIPNPVDTNYFSPAEKNIHRNWLLFRGLMDKPVNIDAALYFIQSIFPIIQKEISQAKLFIVGPNPHKSIKQFADGKQIVVTGKIADVREYITGTGISVCPIRIGTGTRFKILQSWAMGRPVVSTVEGAEGLIYTNGKDIKIAKNSEDFANHVIQLIKNTNIYNSVAKNARQQAITYYSHAVIEKKLNALLTYVKKNTS
jgi:glycosyltransferase involved in cell wall biosynthesis